MNKTESNEKILKLMNKYDELSKKEFKLFKKLMFQCDLKIQDDYGGIPLIYALRCNKDQDLNLSEEQWDYLIKNSDLKQKDEDDWSPIMYALKYNEEQDLNLNKEQIDYLIKNSDLKQKNYNSSIPLTYALIYNKEQNLNLSEEQWDYLIKNSDLKQKDNYGWTPFLYALIYNKDQNLQLSEKQFQTMYECLDKEETFKNLIQTSYEYDHQYLEEINLLLYNFKFQPNEETINWLKENKHQDIIQMIEKRDVLLQLNQDFKEIDKHKK